MDCSKPGFPVHHQSLAPLPSKSSLNIWKILNHVLLKFIPPEIKHTMQLRQLKLQDYIRIENRSIAYTHVNTEFLISSKCGILNQCYDSSSPQSLALGLISWKTIFPLTRVVADGFGMIQVYYTYCVLYFYYYCLSSTSDHEALDPGVWKPLIDNLKWILFYSDNWKINQWSVIRGQELNVHIFSQLPSVTPCW